MRVVFSPWRTTTSASAAVASSDGGTSRRAKAKRSTNDSSSSHSACDQRRIQACFISGRSSKRAYGGGGTSKRQRKSSKMSGASSPADINSNITNSSALLPLLALTSDHKISVISESLVGSAAASSRGDASPSLIEDSRWTYESRPGPTTAFLPQQEFGKAVRVNGGSKNKKNSGASSNGGKSSKNNGNIAKTSSTTAIPSIPAVFDASSSRIFALQNGNTTISCWDTSDPAMAGPDDNDDKGNASSCTVTLPNGRYAVSMHRLPTSATRSEGGSSRTSNCGVAGVLDDGTLYAAMFVSSKAALRVGYFEADCSNEGRGENISRRGSRGRKSTSIASLGGDNLRHLITIVSPGGDVSSTTAVKAGTKRKGAMSTMAESSAVSSISFTARVVFHDEDTGALRLVRHNVSVMVSSDEDALDGEVESHLYPPIHLSLPKGEHDDGGCGDEHGEEESIVIGPSSIQCARLDSTAMAVAFQVPSALDDPNDGYIDEESNDRLDGSAEGRTWYCIHLEGRNGEVTSAPFPLEVMPGCNVARIAGLAPNLVAVLSAPSEDNEAVDDDEDSDTVLSPFTASLVVYDIRRSVAVQALDLPLKVDAALAKSSRFSSWNMLSDYRDGTIAVLASTRSGQSTYISASKLMTESSDPTKDVSMSRSLNQSTGLKRKYNLAAAIASAVSVSDDMGSSMSDALVPASGLGRDIRLILPPSSVLNSMGKADNDENGLEALVGETMQAIDDVQVAFELDGLRTFLADINISEEDDEMATSFETAYVLSVSSLLESSSQNRRQKPTDTSLSPRSIANGSSQQNHHTRSTADRSTAAAPNSQYLPPTFVDGAFDIALGISLQIHASNGDSGNEEDAVNSDAMGKIYSALWVLIKLIRTGKISARDHLAGGVMRSILLASQQMVDAADDVSPTSSSSSNDESPSALTIIDSILCNSSDDIPEAILVSMLHHVLCYATVGDVVTFFSSPRQQRRQYLAPQKVQVLIDQMNETSAEVLLLEKEKTTKKKGRAPTKKRKEEMVARLDELTTLTCDLEASILSTGIHFFADRIVSYSTANSSLLRTAMIDTLVHAKRGEATAMLSVLTKLLAMPSSVPKLSGKQPTGFHTTSIVQWISALTDAHLPALLDAEGAKEVTTARKAVAAAIGQGEVIASMKDLVDTAIRASLSAAGASTTHSKRKSTSKAITYDSAGRKRLTIIQKDPERTTRSRPASAYSIERLVI